MGRGQKKFDDKKKWCNAGQHWCLLGEFGKCKREASGLQPYCRSCLAKRKYKYVSKEKVAAYMRDYNRRRTHGISTEVVLAMLVAQQYTCVVCGDPIDLSANVDHDHVTKVIRELLCPRCNKGLGLFRDNPELLEVAAAYLRKHAALNSQATVLL